MFFQASVFVTAITMISVKLP